jgi:hypothetical protein
MKHYIQCCAIYIVFVFMNKCLFSYILYIKLSFLLSVVLKFHTFLRHNVLYTYVKFEHKNLNFEFNLLLFKNCKIYINKKYVIRIVWNETLHTVLCHIHFACIYEQMSFFLYISLRWVHLTSFFILRHCTPNC